MMRNYQDQVGMYVQCMYSTCTVHVQYMYGACTVHIQYMYSACTVHVQYMYSACTVHVLKSVHIYDFKIRLYAIFMYYSV